MKTKNIKDKEAVVKLAEMVKGMKTAMLLTRLGVVPVYANPMTTKRVSDDGTLWFLSSLNSDHNLNIQSDNRVQLLYSNPDDNQYLSIYGKAFIRDHQNILKDLYTKEDDVWFEGVSDVNLTAIEVTPQEAYYWDKKKNKFISMLEGILPRNEDNDGITKGKMEINE
jgi:general stress protein 26